MGQSIPKHNTSRVVPVLHNQLGGLPFFVAVLLCCSSKLVTSNTVRDASTNDPKSSGTNFIEGHTSSLVLYLVVTMPDDEVCDVTYFFGKLTES